MAITATTGGTINNAVAGTTLSFGAFASTATQTITVAVAILTTTVSVSTITDTALNTYTLKSSQNNSTNVRVELWEASNIAANAANVILVTMSGASLASAAFEEYAGSTAIGNVGTPATGSNGYPQAGAATQDTSSWVITAVAAATTSGDTFAAQLGTLRRSLVPALTTAAVALIDNTSVITSPALRGMTSLSTARNWAATALELRSGITATTAVESKTIINNPANVLTGHQATKASASAQLPPAGSANSGFVA